MLSRLIKAISARFPELPGLSPPPIVAVLRLSGIISPGAAAGPFGGGLSIASTARMIEAAFAMPGLKAVALVINSPGGSPAQSSLMHHRIRALADEKDMPVFAFAEDAAASGGYMLAIAADEIFADANSIVGSIGVISSGFGFTGLIDKLGIERRVHTAGAEKAMLDPFQPENPEHVRRLLALQEEIHQGFKRLVQARRGTRLRAEEAQLFSGEFWTAGRALELGLIDGIGDVRSVMRARYGEDVVLRPISMSRPWWRRGAGAGVSMGGPSAGGWANELLGAIEARLWWNRLGL